MCADSRRQRDDTRLIPSKWKQAVIRILRSNADAIITKKRSDREWEELFPGCFSYERFEALARALSTPGIHGKPVYGMDEEGETWEFLFFYKEVHLYSKINLLPSGQIIILYSSHRPKRPYL